MPGSGMGKEVFKGGVEGVKFQGLPGSQGQYTILLMPLFILYRCPKCFESVTLIQPQHKNGAFKGPARGQCLNCRDEQEYDLTQPANRKAILKTVIPKAETLT